MREESEFIKRQLELFNQRERRRADPFSCPRYHLEDLTFQEIEMIVQLAKEEMVHA